MMMMKMMHFRSLKAQRGIVAVMAVIFLITAVIFVLTQTLSNSGSASIDNNLQRESTAALFLAESGLERAKAQISMAVKGTFTRDNCCINGTGTCTTLGFPSAAQNLGTGTTGTYSYTAASALPANCGNTALNPCTSCEVTVKGSSGNANREIAWIFGITPGTAPPYCNADTTADCSNQTASGTSATWALGMPGYTSAFAGIGVFNLAVDLAAGDAGCWTSGCPLLGNLPWTLKKGSILGMGNTVVQTTASQMVYQKLSATRNDTSLAGVVFPASSAGAMVVNVNGYSDSVSIAGQSTVGGSADLKGQTTNGGAALAWCDDSTAANGTNMALVMGFSAHSNNAKSNNLTSGQVLFDTRATTSGIALTNATKSPTTADTNAGNKVYSEIWYKSNPAYSYGKWITGQIVPTPVIVNLDLKKQESRGKIRAPSPDGYIFVGDVIDPATCTNGSIPAGTAITGFATSETGTCSATVPPIVGNWVCLSLAPTNNGNTCQNAEFVGGFRSTLEITGAVNGGVIAIGDLVAGTNVTQGSIILSQVTPPHLGFSATYKLDRSSSSAASTAQTMVVGGATVNGNTVTLATGATLPATGTLVSVRSVIGNTAVEGRLAQNTSVSSLGTNSFVLSQTALLNSYTGGAVICGGSCALFDHASTKTEFRVATSSLPSGTDYWAAGFVCLKNVNTPPSVLPGGASGFITPGAWGEVIR